MLDVSLQAQKLLQKISIGACSFLFFSSRKRPQWPSFSEIANIGINEWMNEESNQSSVKRIDAQLVLGFKLTSFFLKSSKNKKICEVNENQSCGAQCPM